MSKTPPRQHGPRLGHHRRGPLSLPGPLDYPITTLHHLSYATWCELSQRLGHHEAATHPATWRAARGFTLLAIAVADATTRGGLRYHERQNVYIGWKHDGILPPTWKPRHHHTPYLCWHQFYPQIRLLRDWLEFRLSPFTSVRETLDFLSDRLIGTTRHQLYRTMERLVTMSSNLRPERMTILAPNASIAHLLSADLLQRRIHPSLLDPQLAIHRVELIPTGNSWSWVTIRTSDVESPMVQTIRSAIINVLHTQAEERVYDQTPQPREYWIHVPRDDYPKRNELALELATLWYRPDATSTGTTTADPKAVALAACKELIQEWEPNIPAFRAARTIPVQEHWEWYKFPNLYGPQRIKTNRRPAKVFITYTATVGGILWGLDRQGWWLPISEGVLNDAT